jgi:Fe-S-cluster-containing hydrogenase component 2
MIVSADCIACAACEPECPAGAIRDDAELGWTVDGDLCSGCPDSEPPPCVVACPVDAVIVEMPVERRAPVVRPLQRLRGVLRREPGQSDAGPLLADLRWRAPPAAPKHRRFRQRCTLECDDGSTLRLNAGDAILFAREARIEGTWRMVAPTLFATPFAERALSPHEYVEIRGRALLEGDAVVVVGEVEQAFVDGSGGYRSAPAVAARAMRVHYVADADVAEALAELDALLDVAQR